MKKLKKGCEKNVVIPLPSSSFEVVVSLSLQIHIISCNGHATRQHIYHPLGTTLRKAGIDIVHLH